MEFLAGLYYFMSGFICSFGLTLSGYICIRDYFEGEIVNNDEIILNNN